MCSLFIILRNNHHSALPHLTHSQILTPHPQAYGPDGMPIYGTPVTDEPQGVEMYGKSPGPEGSQGINLYGEGVGAGGGGVPMATAELVSTAPDMPGYGVGGVFGSDRDERSEHGEGGKGGGDMVMQDMSELNISADHHDHDGGEGGHGHGHGEGHGHEGHGGHEGHNTHHADAHGHGAGHGTEAHGEHQPQPTSDIGDLINDHSRP